MPRVELSLLLIPFVVALAAPAAAATADDPHLDPALLPGGCPSCHVGHGKPGSPMLPAAQREVCLSCHGTLADRDLQVSVGGLTLEADPGLIGDSLDQQSTHPMTSDAFDSERDVTPDRTRAHAVAVRSRFQPGDGIPPPLPEFRPCRRRRGENRHDDEPRQADRATTSSCRR